MPDDLDRGKLSEQLGRPVGRAVIHDQDMVGVPEDLSQDPFEVLLFVMNRDGGEESHRRAGPGDEEHRVAIQRYTACS